MHVHGHWKKKKRGWGEGEKHAVDDVPCPPPLSPNPALAAQRKRGGMENTRAIRDPTKAAPFQGGGVAATGRMTHPRAV